MTAKTKGAFAMKNFWAVLMLVFFLGGLQPSNAQLFGDPKTKAELLLEADAVSPGQEVRAAFRLTMDDHWHTYWIYPGDVGLPTEAEWKLPDGWQASAFSWPTPTKLETSGLVSYGYEHEVLLPFTLKVPADAKPGESVELGVLLKWLECEQACVPGEKDFKMSLKVAEVATESEQKADVEKAFSLIPPTKDGLKANLQGQEILLEIPAELEGDKVQFFPDRKGLITDAAPQTLVDEGGRMLKLAGATPDTESKEDGESEGASEPATKLTGILSDGEVAFHISADITTAPVIKPPAPISTILFTAAAAFLGGLVLNLMPCVFPVLSLKVLGIVEQSNSEGRPAWHHGVVFAFGVLVSFWVMSGILLIVRAAGQGVGWGYHLQNPLMIGFLAILFLLIGLNLFGVFEVGENLTQLSGVAEKKEGFAHSFWSGVLTTLAATPCTAPFMGGAVGFALSQPAWVALLIFSSLALGVAAPYMALTLFPALLNKLPRPGAWMVTFKQILAFPMLVAVVWLTWVFGSQMGTNGMALLLLAQVGISLACWIYGKWASSFDPKTKNLGTAAAALTMVLSLYLGYFASQPPAGAELWKDYSPELISQLEAEGKPYFLDFTADWCTSCKANELIALSSDEIFEKFESKNVTLVKGDWTSKDPIITQALAKYGRAGVPLYVLSSSDGSEPQILPEVLLPGTVEAALDKLK